MNEAFSEMKDRQFVQDSAESVYRIEPTALEDLSPRVADLVADVSAKAAVLSSRLHPRTAASLADLVRIMNSYYSNLIEGHRTLPRDIERAARGAFASDEAARDLQQEALSHIRLQRWIDRLATDEELPEPASIGFVRELHRRFYDETAESARLVEGAGGRRYQIEPGEFRREAFQDVRVGRHVPPRSADVVKFMERFESRFAIDRLGSAGRIVCIAIAHHRFNYVHPFPDGNGRVSRLMSHAMAHRAGIGAHGMWSISRGLARGIGGGEVGRGEYLRQMDAADAPRESDLDGRGNLSRRALVEFVIWFLAVCLDQITFMTDLFAIDELAKRLERYAREESVPELGRVFTAVLTRGEVTRGEATTIIGASERTARSMLSRAIALGILASSTAKGPVSLRFPVDVAERLFPRLFPVA